MTHMNKHFLFRNSLVFGLALLGSLVATPADAQEEYAVAGVVADSAGAKLNGAMVVALSLPDSVLRKFSLSNGDGAFTLTRLTRVTTAPGQHGRSPDRPA